MTNELIRNWNVNNDLRAALSSGDHALGVVPLLLRRVLEEGTWREFSTPNYPTVTHETFAEFVTEPPTKGLGADVALIRRIVADDTSTRDLLDQELSIKPGRHRANDNVTSTTGNSADTALRRLRKDRPDLHAKVIADELSPHAAMVQAGFRPKTVTVRTDNVSRAAAQIRRAFNGRLAELVAALEASS